MTPRKKLESQFDNAMMTVYHRAKDEANYNATIFFKMLDEYRGLTTAQMLIASRQPSEGYTALYERKRLDLTVEALIIENPCWHPLFTEDELTKARMRLRDYHYEPRTSPNSG